MSLRILVVMIIVISVSNRSDVNIFILMMGFRVGLGIEDVGYHGRVRGGLLNRIDAAAEG
jgi:hypothetical protein